MSENMVKTISQSKITFVGRISKMGDQKKFVTIPRNFWDLIKDLEKMKQVKVTIEEAYDSNY